MRCVLLECEVGKRRMMGIVMAVRMVMVCGVACGTARYGITGVVRHYVACARLTAATGVARLVKRQGGWRAAG